MTIRCAVTAVFLGLSSIACHSSPTLGDAGVDAAAADVGTDQVLSEAGADAAEKKTRGWMTGLPMQA